MSDKLVIGCGYLGRRVAARRRPPAIASSPRRAPPPRRGIPTPRPRTRSLRRTRSRQSAGAAGRGGRGLLRRPRPGGRRGHAHGVRGRPGERAGRRWTADGGGSFTSAAPASTPSATARRWTRRRRRNRRRSPAASCWRRSGCSRERRPDAVILRFAGIYGPGRLIREKDVRGRRSRCPATRNSGSTSFTSRTGPRRSRPPLERGRPGAVYNVCDDRPVRRRDFYARMAEVLRAPPPWFVPPAEGAAGGSGQSAHRQPADA